MWRFSSVLLLVGVVSSAYGAALERASPGLEVAGGKIRECIVQTHLKINQGLVIRDKMPDGFDPSEPCRTTLRSPEGKLLKVKLDLAFLYGQRDFVQIAADQKMWYIDKTCAPCHDEVIESYEITIEFLLTNKSKFQLRYSTNDGACPLLKIVPPLVIKSQNSLTRKVGSSFQLECLTSKDYNLIGENQIRCEALPNRSANWSAPLPTCQRISNCPKVEKVSEVSGHLSLDHNRNENYHCSWQIDASGLDANYIEFVPRYDLFSLGHWGGVGRNRGLAFYDGEGRLKVDSGVGLRYRTRDSTLKIYLNLSAKDLAPAANASFAVDYEISRRTCPTIDEESFPFGSLILTNSFFVGSSVKFECAPGYKMLGKSEAACMNSGNWSFQTVPECVPLSAEINNDLNVISITTEPGNSMQSEGALPSTERDVLAYTDWSLPRSVTMKPNGADSRSGSSTVSVNFHVQQEQTQNTMTPNQIGASSTTVNAERPHFIPTSRPVGDDGDTFTTTTVSEVPVIGSLNAIFQRLQNLDMRSKQDISFLLIVLAILSSAVLVVALLGLAVRHSCRQKIPLRENPLYTGAPARRIQNVSFRPNGKHKRAAQQRNYS